MPAAYKRIEDLEEAVAVMRAGGAPKDVTDRMEQRRCGDCDHCCTAKGIADMEPSPKPCWTACRHLREPHGCSIYDRKPQSCSDYLCAWRLGLGRDSARPDRIDIMVDVEEIEPGDPDRGIPNVLGLVVHARGPYKRIHLERILRDARKVGIVHVAFTTTDEDREETLLRYEADPGELDRMIARHAGSGRTGWNAPAGSENA